MKNGVGKKVFTGIAITVGSAVVLAILTSAYAFYTNVKDLDSVRINNRLENTVTKEEFKERTYLIDRDIHNEKVERVNTDDRIFEELQFIRNDIKELIRLTKRNGRH